MGLLLLSILGVAVTWYFLGNQVGVIALVTWLVGFASGHQAMIASLKGEGYEVDYRADATGKKRWRVGLPTEAPVQWMAPSKTYSAARNGKPSR